MSEQIRTGFEAFFILVLYLMMKFVLGEQIDRLSPYAAYFFELVFVLCVTFLYRQRLRWFTRIDKRVSFTALGVFLFGFVSFKATQWTSVYVPFDLKNQEILLFLILIAPFLEEFLFRFTLWHTIETLVGNRVLLIWIMALFFSFSHFFVFFSVPEEFKKFILFQTAYTFVLGLVLGQIFYKYRAILLPVFFHMLFNVGFFLGSCFTGF